MPPLKTGTMPNTRALIGEEKEGAYRTYHYDMRGSTVAITDENGSVTDRFEYGAYGELLHQTGTTETAFLYNGRDGVMTDANGLYYMRARYYNPEIKRFISEDSFEGKYDNLLNINLHQYAGSNPISFIRYSVELPVSQGTKMIAGPILGGGANPKQVVFRKISESLHLDPQYAPGFDLVKEK